MENIILNVENVSVSKNNHLILDKVSFKVNKGETVAVIGPNGAGKTTLFRALLNLLPFEGKIEWKTGIKIGYVPQKLYVDQDIPLSTYEFFSLKEKNKNKIKEALSAVGLTSESTETGNIEKHILENRMGVLSGGELQRVLIAWALLGNPEVLLFDEPTAGVDIIGEESIYMMLDRLKKTKSMTILLISHELEIVYKYANKVVCINKEKVCYGPPLTTLTKENIDKLFGEEMGFYQHEHNYNQNG